MDIHDGHRDRLRNRFIEYGLESFDEHTALELLLFYAKVRGDVNPLAHQLINRFGSISGVMDAPLEDLLKVDGIGKNTAVLLKLIPQLGQRYMVSKSSTDCILNTSQTAGQYLVPRFFGEKDEVVYMVCMDAKYKVLNCRLLFRGSVNTANISLRRIVENALNSNASNVIIAHNHTSGIAIPSNEDVDVTKRIIQALSAVDITLTDHIVVADDDFVSMADSKLI